MAHSILPASISILKRSWEHAACTIWTGSDSPRQNIRSAGSGRDGFCDDLNTLDPDRHMLTLGSLEIAPRDYFIDGIRFRQMHAYVAPLVDQEQQAVMLINPHDSTKPLVVPYRTILNAFRVLRRVEFDVENTYK